MFLSLSKVTLCEISGWFATTSSMPITLSLLTGLVLALEVEFGHEAKPRAQEHSQHAEHSAASPGAGIFTAFGK